MLTDEAVARHQMVRMLVEHEHPSCRVAEIDEHTLTTYRQMLNTPGEYVLLRVEALFNVVAEAVVLGAPDVRCRVALDSDGTLRITDTEFSR